MIHERTSPAGFAVHPGEILKEEFLVPLNISGYALAKALSVPAQAVSDITLRKRGISADMALRLARFFGTSEQFWMNLQSAYELAIARKAAKKAVRKIRPYKTDVA
jgi:addiction module HigA family antidote